MTCASSIYQTALVHLCVIPARLNLRSVASLAHYYWCNLSSLVPDILTRQSSKNSNVTALALTTFPPHGGFNIGYRSTIWHRVLRLDPCDGC